MKYIVAFFLLIVFFNSCNSKSDYVSELEKKMIVDSLRYNERINQLRDSVDFLLTKINSTSLPVLSDSEQSSIIKNFLHSIYDPNYHEHPDLMSEAWLDKHCSKELKKQLREGYVDYPNSEGYAIWDLEGRVYGEDIGLDFDKISHDDRYYYVFLKPCVDYYKGTRILRLEIDVVYGIAVIKNFEWIKDFD